MAHTHDNPEHIHFWLSMRERWHVEPQDGPVSGPTRHVVASDGNRRQKPVSHRAQNSGVVRRCWDRAVRLAGPMYVASVSAAMGGILALARAGGMG